MRFMKAFTAVALAAAALSTAGCAGGPVPGTAAGAIPMGLWVMLFVAALMAILASVQNAVVGLLYLAGRPGNDDLPTRDQWLARNAERAEAAAPAETAAPAPAPAPEGGAS